MNIQRIVLSISFVLFSYVAFTQQMPKEKFEILTPKPGPAPRLNNPLVYGARPGHAFLFRIPCQGTRPMNYAISGLPATLHLDSVSGIITGTVPARGTYQMKLLAKNSEGSDTRDFKLIAGNKLSLTPSMGWNDWYAFYQRIKDEDVRKAADLMISSGMADVGYSYVNIDDCWMNAKKGIEHFEEKEEARKGDERDSEGMILPNRYFPDMKKLTGYIHDKGLKAGIYSSPGPYTCGGYVGSYLHEADDARQFANWGFDFLKYDWCSYEKIAGKNTDLSTYKKPYTLMGGLLEKQDRDILLNLCQYGMGNVSAWGAEVGGQSWRTAGDLGYELDRIFDVAINNSKKRQYSKPGSWNDPDYIQIGFFGAANGEGEAIQTKMPPAMQYAYMSLWCLMASPIFFSGDMEKLDDFTLNVLCNREVIEVDQDPLGESGKLFENADSTFILVKTLSDGSKAVGLFNRNHEARQVSLNWKQIQISGKQILRDLWRQKDIGTYDSTFKTEVPAQGVVMLKIIRSVPF
jgi:alpha-galactosidase